MSYPVPKSNPRRNLFPIFLMAFIGLVLFATNAFADGTRHLPYSPQTNSVSPAILSGTRGITQTTVADFNQGSFYLTGMTRSSVAGGDGDGEVRLQTVGISAKDWKSVPNGFPAGLFGHAAAQRNGVVFVSGGVSNPNLMTPQSAVYMATIQSDHSLGTWTTSATNLPVPLWAHGMTVVGNTLFVIGGRTGSTVSNAVYTAAIGAGGALGPFQTAAALPSGRYDFGLTQVNGTIYVIGGNDAGFAATNLVFYTKPDPTSGAIASWSTATMNTPTNIAKHTATSYRDKFYVIGGTDESTFFPYTYFSQPASNGDVASPNFTSTLVIGQNLVFASSATFGGQVYAVGGAVNSNSAGTNIIYSALMSSTGELFNPITNTVSWLQSPVLSNPRVRSASIMSDDGWLYVIGGLTGDLETQASLTSYDYGPTTGDSSSEYAPYGSYTSPIINISGNYSVTNISWNTSITTSNNMSLTLKYYCGNSPTALTVCSSPTSGAKNGIFQTNNIDVLRQAQYWQYVVNFVRGNVFEQSPILNWVRLDYISPPDLAVAGMNAPATFQVTTTVIPTVFISNAISAGYLNRPVSGNPTSPGGFISRTTPRGKNAPSAFTYTYVELYIDPPSPPASLEVKTLGNCYGYLSSTMAPGDTVPVPIDHQSNGTGGGCPIPPGTHAFYVLVDSCDLPNSTSACYDPGSNVYGYVREINETNNIGGPYNSGSQITSGSLYFPLIKK